MFEVAATPSFARMSALVLPQVSTSFYSAACTARNVKSARVRALMPLYGARCRYLLLYYVTRRRRLCGDMLPDYQ